MTTLFRTLNPSEDKASDDKCRGKSRIENPVKSRRYMFQVESLVRRAVANQCCVLIMRLIDENKIVYVNDNVPPRVMIVYCVVSHPGKHMRTMDGKAPP